MKAYRTQKKIQQEENIFTISLALAYDSYVESSESYIVLRPLFTKEHNKQKLTTNKLTFNLQNEDESFSWKYEAMDSFQKAQVTFKGLSLSSDAENKLRFRLVKSKTGTRYPLETRLVSNNSQTYEFEIPQYIGLDEIALENAQGKLEQQDSCLCWGYEEGFGLSFGPIE